MTQEQFETRMQELMQTKAFYEKVEACSCPQEIADLFKNEGIDINADDVIAYFNALQENDDITDEQLESVAGGSALGVTIISFLITKGLPWAWSTLPGKNNQQKMKALVDFWYKKLRKK